MASNVPTRKAEKRQELHQRMDCARSILDNVTARRSNDQLQDLPRTHDEVLEAAASNTPLKASNADKKAIETDRKDKPEYPAPSMQHTRPTLPASTILQLSDVSNDVMEDIVASTTEVTDVSPPSPPHGPPYILCPPAPPDTSFSFNSGRNNGGSSNMASFPRRATAAETRSTRLSGRSRRLRPNSFAPGSPSSPSRQDTRLADFYQVKASAMRSSTGGNTRNNGDEFSGIPGAHAVSYKMSESQNDLDDDHRHHQSSGCASLQSTCQNRHSRQVKSLPGQATQTNTAATVDEASTSDENNATPSTSTGSLPSISIQELKASVGRPRAASTSDNTNSCVDDFAGIPGAHAVSYKMADDSHNNMNDQQNSTAQRSRYSTGRRHQRTNLTDLRHEKSLSVGRQSHNSTTAFADAPTTTINFNSNERSNKMHPDGDTYRGYALGGVSRKFNGEGETKAETEARKSVGAIISDVHQAHSIEPTVATVAGKQKYQEDSKLSLAVTPTGSVNTSKHEIVFNPIDNYDQTLSVGTRKAVGTNVSLHSTKYQEEHQHPKHHSDKADQVKEDDSKTPRGGEDPTEEPTDFNESDYCYGDSVAAKPIIATKCEDDDVAFRKSRTSTIWATATPHPDDSCGFATRRGRWIILVAALSILIAIGLIVYFTVAPERRGHLRGDDGNNSNSNNNPEDKYREQELFFNRVGTNILDGVNIKDQFGLSIATNEDGTRIVVSDLTAVYVYELQEQPKKVTEPVEAPIEYGWVMLGTEIRQANASLGTSQEDYHEYASLSMPIRSPIVTEISSSGDFVAIGYPLQNHQNDENGTVSEMRHVGVVEVYQYRRMDNSWVPVGNTIIGSQQSGYFGTSLSFSDDGSIIVVGALGDSSTTSVGGGYVQAFYINKGTWEPRGSPISGSNLDLSVYSVSLSGDGSSIALGGVPSNILDTDGADGAVAKVFEWYAGDWIERGTGIGQTIGNTSYLAQLSSDGQTVVVSNYYLSDADSNTGVGLDVRAFMWSNEEYDWIPLGSNMHANFESEKSGYFISLSSNGRRILMGDPGRRFGTAGATGHAHIFQLESVVVNETTTALDWVQVGPNIWGEAAGDQFGYAVSLSGNGERLVVSAPFNRGAGFERGRVQVYEVAPSEL